MSKHTEGPWSFAHNGAGDFKTACIDICQSNSKEFRGQVAYLQSAEHIEGITMAECGANARLIAAAPDLLEALEDLTDDIAGRFDMDSPSTNPGMVAAVHNARAAIAKARGES
jgi:hypothetical protein